MALNFLFPFERISKQVYFLGSVFLRNIVSNKFHFGFEVACGVTFTKRLRVVFEAAHQHAHLPFDLSKSSYKTPCVAF